MEPQLMALKRNARNEYLVTETCCYNLVYPKYWSMLLRSQ